MTHSFQIDLSKYSLQKFKESLQVRELIPSRVTLKDDIDARFQILTDEGIENLQEFIDALKNKAKINAFADRTSLPID